MANETIKNHAAFIWSVADLLRGDYKQSEYGRVILPLTVLRRLDCVLEPTKAKVLAEYEQAQGQGRQLRPGPRAGSPASSSSATPRQLRLRASCSTTRTTSADNLRAYIAGFSRRRRTIIDKFDFDTQIDRLDKANLLYLVVGKFADLDLHPDTVSNLEMGYLYEELIRRFSELSNETAGEHFTPREVIRLMVNLLFAEDDDLLAKPGVVKTLFDPACGTGGMLSVAEDYLRQLNPDARLEVFGQELNAETYAICRSDMMLKGQDASNIVFGNSFSEDGHHGQHVRLPARQPAVRGRVEEGRGRRQGRAREAGLRRPVRCRAAPHQRRQSFLFLQHMISKMKRPEDGGSRLAIVFNGSPLFTGAAGSGESEIRRWIIENDWLEAIVALPDQLFYNTGISTYFWIVTNRKSPERRGKVQLIDARESFTKMRKSLGEKRKQIADDQIADIVRLYGDFEPKATGSRSSPTKTSGSCASPSSAPSGSAGRSPTTPSPPLDADQKSGQARQTTPRRAARRRRSRRVRGSGAGRPHRELTSAGPCRSAARRSRPERQGRSRSHRRRARRPRPRRRPQTDRKGNPEPDPDLRDNENVPLPDRSPSPTKPTRPHRLAHHRLPHRHRPSTSTAEVHPLRPRRLGRPRQDQDRLRDPPHPPLLHLHTTPTPRRDRRRDQSTRSRDPGPPRRGDRVSWTAARRRVGWQSLDAESIEHDRPTPRLLRRIAGRHGVVSATDASADSSTDASDDRATSAFSATRRLVVIAR